MCSRTAGLSKLGFNVVGKIDLEELSYARINGNDPFKIISEEVLLTELENAENRFKKLSAVCTSEVFRS